MKSMLPNIAGGVLLLLIHACGPCPCPQSSATPGNKHTDREPVEGNPPAGGGGVELPNTEHAGSPEGNPTDPGGSSGKKPPDEHPN